MISEGNVPIVVAGLDVAADIFCEDVELVSAAIEECSGRQFHRFTAPK